MKALTHFALLLLIIGSLNWGAVGAISFNPIETLLGNWPLAIATIYDLVGLAGCFMLFQLTMCAMGKGGCCKNDCKK